VIYDWFKDIEFGHPQFFGLFLILPIIILWYITANNKQQGTMIVSSVNPFGRADSWKTVFRHVPFILRVLGITALIIALARPQTRNDEQIITGQGIDIILCMDVSGSMLAQDFLPNRLEAMKQVAVDFVDKRPTDRIGLVVFAGESFTVCPITTDRAMLKSHIVNRRWIVYKCGAIARKQGKIEGCYTSY
jgi:Ca-activated chloride channel homolog